MRRLSAWFRSHPLTAIFLVLIGVAVGTHLLANWRAEVRWQRYCAAARARGVKLTLAEFAPPEIPDAENFAALPMFKAIFLPGAKDSMALPDVPGGKPGFGAPQKAEHFDWQKWQTYFKAAGFIAETTDSPPRDVLRALEHYAPQLKEWSEWKNRPRCRFSLDLKAGAFMPLPHLGMFVNAAKLFSLRMRAHLALGDSSAAYGDFREGLQAYRALIEEPVLLSGLVRIAAMDTLLSAVGEGLAAHAWTEPELKKIADDLFSIHVGDDYLRAFSSERGIGNFGDDQIVALPPWQRGQKLLAVNAGASAFGTTSHVPGWVFFVIPKRLCRDNQLRYNQYMDEMCDRVSRDRLSFGPEVGMPTHSEELEGWDAYYFFLFSQPVPVFANVAERFVHLLTKLDQTRLAVALERCRLARGAYPETLPELVPDFISEVPMDVYSRQPLIYHRKEGGTFLLYGVGKNRTDDGAKINPVDGQNQQRDAIWFFAPPPSK